ncbi:DUF72 domain-containing protein [Rhodococcus sp. IEGM 1366]|uniref:DUF72 domain-containing protein n=1 Tax=Rhodococcus sp. IEGM 1366 TaxID=3082223 RepID=UPI0029529850|nr:DUF72 domain-containing protein [Rhodococcus sp. IEGM 1366]MDV8065102.1 DUF72 domain-containing protein [Rhodococcus sp. IEGM 1366]
MADIRVGISGWTYPAWRGDFYPSGLAHRKELSYAAEKLTSIEINGSFYALQKPESFAKWRSETPDDFVFALKGGRYITHMKRLLDTQTGLANFFAAGVLALGPKLGPIFWQLPPTLQFEPERLASFFELLPRTTTQAAELAAHHDDKLTEDRVLAHAEIELPIRYAVEARHASFAVPEAVELMREHDIGFVVADTAGRYPQITTPTSDFVYLRMHGDKELYASGYTDKALDSWSERAQGWMSDELDVFVYFDNDMKGFAPHNAMAFLARFI